LLIKQTTRKDLCGSILSALAVFLLLRDEAKGVVTTAKSVSTQKLILE